MGKLIFNKYNLLPIIESYKEIENRALFIYQTLVENGLLRFVNPKFKLNGDEVKFNKIDENNIYFEVITNESDYEGGSERISTISTLPVHFLYSEDFNEYMNRVIKKEKEDKDLLWQQQIKEIKKQEAKKRRIERANYEKETYERLKLKFEKK